LLKTKDELILLKKLIREDKLSLLGEILVQGLFFPVVESIQKEG